MRLPTTPKTNLAMRGQHRPGRRPKLRHLELELRLIKDHVEQGKGHGACSRSLLLKLREPILLRPHNEFGHQDLAVRSVAWAGSINASCDVPHSCVLL